MKNSSTDQNVDSLPSLSEIYGDSQRFSSIFRWLVILIMLGIIAAIFIVLTTDNHFAAVALGLSLFPIFATLYLIQHKEFERAAVFLAVVLITLNTVLATNGLGIHHISNIAYPAILIIASLVTSKRTMAWLTLFAVGCVAWLVFGELSGIYTPEALVSSVPGDFISAATILVITALMIRQVAETFFQNNLQLQKELRERKLAEEKYRNIFENAIDGIFQSTIDGRFVSVNPAMARMYGYDSPEQMLQTVTNIASQIYVEPELRNVLRLRLADGEQVTGFESQEYRRDGSTLWISMNIQAIHDIKGNILYYEGTVEDITLRKEMEIKQKEVELLYRSLVEQTSIVVYRDAPDESASALYVSPQIKTLLGYSAEEWLSDPVFWKKQIHPQDLQRVLADIKHYMSEKGGSSIEYRIQTKDGDWRWVRDEAVIVKDEAGNAQFVQGVISDITERKLAEMDLLAFRKLMDESNDAIFFVDPQTSRYIDFNRSAHEKLGYSREELSQLGVIDIAQHITSIDVWYVRVDLVSAQKDGLVFESVYQRKDRTMFPVEVSARMLDYEDRTIMLAIVRDITERKQAETALHESEERYRTLFDRILDGMYRSSHDGKFLDVNPAMLKIFGYDSREEMLAIDIKKEMYFAPEERESLFLDTGQEKVDEFRMRRKDGSEVWVEDHGHYIHDKNGNVVFHEGILRDITERKQAEFEREQLIAELAIKNAESETLRESFASIVGTLEFGEIIEHILDQIGRVVPFDSASVWRLEGNIQKLIASRNLPAEHLIEEMEIKVDEINSAIPILRGQVPYILNHNVQEELLDFKDPPHNIINSWLAIPLKTRGKIIGLIALDGYKNDQFNEHHAQLAVTFANQVAIALENARLFSELQYELLTREKLINELESKNTELERFTYTVSHDLKSPLVTINGFLGYLKGDAASGNSERVNMDIHRIQDAVDKMHLLLKDLLELSRIGRIMNPPESILLADLVSEALEIVHGRLEARGVTVLTQPNLPTVHGDRQRLMAVLQNLIDNAAKYMGDQTAPQIEIGQDQQAAENSTPIFYVRDNGMGIPSQHHERIFGLFDKLDPKSEGTGVGLALVKRIIEVHGGRIWVESEMGKGSTFYFTIAANNS